MTKHRDRNQMIELECRDRHRGIRRGGGECSWLDLAFSALHRVSGAAVARLAPARFGVGNAANAAIR